MAAVSVDLGGVRRCILAVQTGEFAIFLALECIYRQILILNLSANTVGCALVIFVRPLVSRGTDGTVVGGAHFVDIY